MENSFHVGLHEYYNFLALEYYQKYLTVNNEYNKLTNNNQSWNILSHSREDNEKYFRLCNERQNYSIIAIVFEAFSVEALINCYGAEELGEDVFNKKYERMNIRLKYIEVIKAATGKEFDKESDSYKMLDKLVDIRNNLAHSKSVKFDLNSEDLQGYMDNVICLLGNKKESIYEIVDKVIGTYKELKKILIEMENK